jgi:hypothetical protein
MLATMAVAFALTFGTFEQPSFRNYGVIHTSLGLAVVTCGGETSEGCGNETAIGFAACSPEWHGYFAETSSPTTTDRLVRTLIGKRPPSGNRWVVECGAAGPMFQGEPLARLKSN